MGKHEIASPPIQQEAEGIDCVDLSPLAPVMSNFAAWQDQAKYTQCTQRTHCPKPINGIRSRKVCRCEDALANRLKGAGGCLQKWCS